jgi:glutathione synthase/RimK-type ligase-like ATP-grasp enzyme
MVLVVTNRDDLTADWLLIELQRRGAKFARFNTEDYPRDVALSWSPAGHATLRLPDENVALDEVQAVWFRRPLVPQAPEGVDDELAMWAVREAQEALDGLWRTLDARWVNHPDANLLAGCKPEQLRRAARAGFDVPRTLVTNDAEQLHAFAMSCDSQLVCKPLYDGWVASARTDRVFWTTKFDFADADDFDDLGGEPYLFQALVPKRYDVRVTVIGNDAFAVAIGSQEVRGSEIDWRRGAAEHLEHRVEALPLALERRCVDFVSGYGLAFGAIDLARRPDDGYTFFELNPNGQWAWLEQRTDLPLRARLADLLLEGT